MSTDTSLARRTNGFPGPLVHFTGEDVETIRGMLGKDLSDSELRVFLARCERTGLDPLAGQIYAIVRQGVMAIQVGVDGLRSKAVETGAYDGEDPPQWCGSDGKWRDIWLAEEPPVAARVAIYRKCISRPVVGIVTYRAYCQWNKYGKPASRWLTDPAGMLAKCAIVQALRKGFPQVLGSMTREGLEIDDAGEGKTPEPDAAAWAAQWRRRFFETVRDSPIDTKEGRASFLRSYTLGHTSSLAEFLATATDESAELLIVAAASAAEAQPKRSEQVRPRNDREAAIVADYEASGQAAVQREQRSPEQQATNAREYHEVFGPEENERPQHLPSADEPVSEAPLVTPPPTPPAAPVDRKGLMRRYGALCHVAVDLHVHFEDLPGDASDEQVVAAVAELAAAVNAAMAAAKGNGGAGR